MKLNYYVYYRVPARNAERARAAVASLQRDLAGATGIGGKVLRRRDDESTWMEIYEGVEDEPRFEAALAELVERHGVEALVAPNSPRKQEIFRGF
jgi:hypothetical protein